MIIYVLVKKNFSSCHITMGISFHFLFLLKIDYISKNHMAWLVINIRKGLKRKNFCTFWIQPITNILEKRKKPYFIYVLIIIHLKDIHWIRKEYANWTWIQNNFIFILWSFYLSISRSITHISIWYDVFMMIVIDRFSTMFTIRCNITWKWYLTLHIIATKRCLNDIDKVEFSSSSFKT